MLYPRVVFCKAQKKPKGGNDGQARTQACQARRQKICSAAGGCSLLLGLYNWANRVIGHDQQLRPQKQVCHMKQLETFRKKMKQTVLGQRDIRGALSPYKLGETYETHIFNNCSLVYRRYSCAS